MALRYLHIQHSDHIHCLAYQSLHSFTSSPNSCKLEVSSKSSGGGANPPSKAFWHFFFALYSEMPSRTYLDLKRQLFAAFFSGFSLQTNTIDSLSSYSTNGPQPVSPPWHLADQDSKYSHSAHHAVRIALGSRSGDPTQPQFRL